MLIEPPVTEDRTVVIEELPRVQMDGTVVEEETGHPRIAATHRLHGKSRAYLEGTINVGNFAEQLLGKGLVIQGHRIDETALCSASQE
jgi:hypothetical protein